MCELTEWLHRWQELVGALIGAAALLITVWVTLGSERRKRDAEATALKIALGSELRQFGLRSLLAHKNAVALMERAPNLEYTRHMVLELKLAVTCPAPVIYPHSAASLGILGEDSYIIVQFYNQLVRVRDLVEELDPVSTLKLNDGYKVAVWLLRAAELVVQLLPRFARMPGANLDDRIITGVSEAQSSFTVLGRKLNLSADDP